MIAIHEVYIKSQMKLEFIGLSINFFFLLLLYKISLDELLVVANRWFYIENGLLKNLFWKFLYLMMYLPRPFLLFV